ncbi:cytochrome c [Pelagimonas sp. KU-00592-HH]|uniref:c-type cytochrome n=1 Tax=Pelagimonas sp. KU-00592-HH TaxID=3127651 RepID=UPI00310B87D5
MRRVLGSFVVVFLGVVLAGCVQVWSPGKATYDAHCLSCHGARGQGDGPFAAHLLIPPADLTVLAAENGGTFPRLRVRQSIEGLGRGEHFSGAMPEFSEVGGRGPAADAQLAVVVDYLERLQQ